MSESRRPQEVISTSPPPMEVDVPIEAYSEDAYKDEDVLRTLYEDYLLSTREMGDILGVTGPTVGRWMDRHGIERRSPDEWRAERYYSDKQYTDPALLRELYHGEGLSSIEIGDRLGVSDDVIRYHMDKHDIERRAIEYEIPQFELSYSVPSKTGFHGYPVWKGCDGQVIPVHKLVLIADGEDPYKVFGNVEYQTHHRNRHRADNRPSNLELLDSEQHGREGQKEMQESHFELGAKTAIQFMLNPQLYMD